MKVLFIVPYGLDLAPGQRFRFEQWLSLLPPGSVDADVRPLVTAEAYQRLYEAGGLPRKAAQMSAGLTRRVRDLLGPGQWDVAFLHRKAFFVGPPILEWLLQQRMPVVYDFDDAIFLNDTSSANAFTARWKQPQNVQTTVAGATTTMVGNTWLAEFAGRFSDRVEIVPTTIDVGKYRPRPRAPGELVRVGWSGSRTTSKHLHTIDDVLRQISERLPVELVTIGDPAFRVDGLPGLRSVPWCPKTELDDLNAIDIGLMPLPDDDWSRGKCGLKALQYMALGIPTVASPVGVNTDMITAGENGLLASTPDEWVEAIGSLVESVDLRRRLGDAGRETVVERYSGQAWAPRFLEILEEASDRPRPARAVGASSGSPAQCRDDRRATHVPSAQRYFQHPSHYLRRNAVIDLRRGLVRELLDGNAPRRIIDVGCGDGSLSTQYLTGGAELALVDFSDTMLEAARANVPDQFLDRVSFSQLDVTSGELGTLGAADVVLCAGVLAHTPDPELTVGRVASLVEPGGRLLLQLTDFDQWAGKGVYWLSRLATDSRRYRLSKTRASEVIQWACQSGLKLVRTVSYPGSVPGYRRLPMQWQESVLRSISFRPSLSPLRTEALMLLEKPA